MRPQPDHDVFDYDDDPEPEPQPQSFGATVAAELAGFAQSVVGALGRVHAQQQAERAEKVSRRGVRGKGAAPGEGGCKPCVAYGKAYDALDGARARLGRGGKKGLSRIGGGGAGE